MLLVPVSHAARFAIWSCAISQAILASAADAPRKYADGPLAPADFRAAVPDPRPVKDGLVLRAMSFTEIRYKTRHRWEESKQGQVTASLVRFDCSSQFDGDKSWDKEPSDLRLLAHEQGHFDISEINARQAQQRFGKLIADKSLVGRGRDERTAVADLNRKIQAEIKAIFDRERDEQVEYDRATNHGRDFESQAKERNRLDERLKESEPKK
jgi:hypothetical protein